MIVKNLFEPSVKAEIKNRIEHLGTGTPAQWGKMNCAQMLAHVQAPLAIALGEKQIKGNLLMRLVFPLFKKKLYDERPFKRGLPTHPSFITTGSDRDFEKEKAILLGMLDSFSETSIITERHPIFGHLTRENWSKATWKHMDHHLRQFGV